MRDDFGYILAIDQGTSATKSLVFDRHGRVVAQGRAALSCSYPKEGLVEQEPMEIIESVRRSLAACLEAFKREVPGASIAACGISNQRETFLLWDKEGKPLAPAVVWQCKRSIPICRELEERGYAATIAGKTGLLLDPYFSATKLIRLYREDEELRRRIDRGEVLFGTIDSWLIHTLSGGSVYATDHTNASRTMLYNINTLSWDEELIGDFSLSGLRLPEVRSSSDDFGRTDLLGLLSESIPISSAIGDSQAAAVGEGLFSSGEAKVTLGTGSSILLNVGDRPVSPQPGLVSTICFGLGDRIEYAIEGIVVSCGSTLTWIKEQLKCAKDDEELSSRAESLENNGGVYLLPAFSGLGVPFWKMEAKAALMGLGFGNGCSEICRAGLESIGFQVKSALDAMKAGAGVPLTSIRFDGGIIHNRFVMQHIAELLEMEIGTMGFPEVSALGAAYLAGVQAGLYSKIEETAGLRASESTLRPRKSGEEKKKLIDEYETWKMYIDRLL